MSFQWISGGSKSESFFLQVDGLAMGQKTCSTAYLGNPLTSGCPTHSLGEHAGFRPPPVVLLWRVCQFKPTLTLAPLGLARFRNISYNHRGHFIQKSARLSQFVFSKENLVQSIRSVKFPLGAEGKQKCQRSQGNQGDQGRASQCKTDKPMVTYRKVRGS